VKPTVTHDWSYRGLQALILDNGLVRVVVLPELGGKIWELHDLVNARQHLWQHPRLPASRVPFGSTFDDVFHGGWDDLFPNDVPENLAGELYPDHGELWALAWDWTASGSADEVWIDLTVSTPISACTMVKRLTLRAGERALRITQTLSNESSRDLPYKWTQHLALSVDEPARIDLPALSVYVEDFGNLRAGEPGQTYTWPILVDADGTEHDMRRTLPQSSERAEFQYATALSDGWCALTHPDGTGIALAFDPDVFPSCWMFASYGGWRDLQVAILEPCTGYPVSVNDGVAAGTHRVLASGQQIETTMTAVLFDGLTEVTGVSRDGLVSGVSR